MRIVHYTLGLYPNRVGGLPRYATDLMKEQAKVHEVYVLSPGRWKFWSNKCCVRRVNDCGRLKCYLMDNALPQPLLYGIRHPEDFIERNISKKSFELFYNKVRPEVMHLHTLMGMPEDVLSFFKGKGVRIVYTSHDYFGICPKVNLINQYGELCVGPNPQRCPLCNANAPLTMYLRFRNSTIAFKIRDVIIWLKNTLRF